ncbi:MAG: serine/threonine protein phosphatase, partial [Mariprofundus sp.]
MGSADRKFWRYVACLWPLMFIFLLGQGLMRLNGNASELGITALLSLVDITVFLLLFCAAAWWTFDPVRRCLGKAVNPEKYRRVIEALMADFPWRALKAYLIAGWLFALYLIAVISLVAFAGDGLFTWRMFVALTLNFCFGAGVLGPALAVASSIIHATRLRLDLSRQGLFSGLLGDDVSGKQIISTSRRPWLVFMVTGLLPTLILSLYVWLALGGSEVEEQFILSQALVLLAMSVAGSVILVWHISNTLKSVTVSLETGLKHLAGGHFKGHVPVLIDDDFGELARGLNTAMKGLQEREDLKDSLAIAAEIQQGLLPKY